MTLRLGVLFAAVGCGRPETPPPGPPLGTDDFDFDELSIEGEIRASEVVVQAALYVSAAGSARPLGEGDSLWLVSPLDERKFASFDTLLLAELPSMPAGEEALEIVLARGDTEGRFPVTLPAPFDLTVEPAEFGGLQRISWEPSEEGAMSLIVESLCLSSRIERALGFDQGFYDVQPADLSLIRSPCELSITVRRAARSGAFAVEQIRTATFLTGEEP